MHITKTTSYLHLLGTRVLDTVSAISLTPDKLSVIVSLRGTYQTHVYDITSHGTFALRSTVDDVTMRCVVYGGKTPAYLPKSDTSASRAEFVAGLQKLAIWQPDGTMTPPQVTIDMQSMQEAVSAGTFYSPYVVTTRMNLNGTSCSVDLRCPRTIWEIVSDKNPVALKLFANDVIATLSGAMAHQNFSIKAHASVQTFLLSNGITLSGDVFEASGVLTNALGIYMGIAVTRSNMVKLAELGIVIPLCVVVVLHVPRTSLQWKYPC
jgi:hypothetical protein